jgi:hypothetical protein
VLPCHAGAPPPTTPRITFSNPLPTDVITECIEYVDSYFGWNLSSMKKFMHQASWSGDVHNRKYFLLCVKY